MERTPYNDLSQHDKELLAKIKKIDNEMSFYGWPEIASLLKHFEDEYQRELWNNTCKHYNHLEEASIGEL